MVPARRMRVYRAKFAVLGSALCFSLAFAEPLAGRDTSLEQTVIALRDALQRVAGARDVDRAVSVVRIDVLLDAARRDPAQAAAKLNEAYALVRSEIRLLGSEGGVTSEAKAAQADAASAASSRRIFERQRTSAVALGDAFTRMAEESRDAGTQQQAAEVSRRIAAADERAAAGDWQEAGRSIEQALELVKLGIRGQREGTTQVRSLAFASANEEYRYEIDRHDSYRMLLTMLSSVEIGDAAAGGSLRQADALRRAAEERAGSGDFTQAVKLMEQATEALQRAIRTAGIYLPG